MSFSSRELSEYSGEPTELYWFMRGSQSWTYAVGTESVEFELETFEPLPGLTRSQMTEGQERSRSQLTVQMPRNAPLVQEYIRIPDQNPVWLYIYQMHNGEAEYRIAWQGRVRAVDFQGNNATITLDNMLGSIKKLALRHFYQNQCNHFTFDSNCGLVEGDYSHTDQVIASVDGTVLTVDNAEAAGYFISGIVRRANGDRRYIIANTKAGSTHTITLLQAFEGLEVGEAVTLIGGACRHTFDTCPIQENYGGYPKVPRKNPFRSFI